MGVPGAKRTVTSGRGAGGCGGCWRRRTILRQSDANAAREIARFCADEEIEQVVLGLPRSPEGVESPFAKRIRSFREKLSRATGLPIDYQEETLTSWQAQSERPSRTKGDIDREAAAILLGDYLAERTWRTQ